MGNGNISNDEIYLRIWEKHQDGLNSRWNITILLTTASFYIFYISFKETLSVHSTIIRIVALIIFWYGYAFYKRYSNWSHHIRTYLKEMEGTASTIKIQSQWDISPWKKSKFFSNNRILLYFGITYSIIAILIICCI